MMVHNKSLEKDGSDLGALQFIVMSRREHKIKMNIPKIIGSVLLVGAVFTWKYILTPLAFFSMPPKMSIPIIVGLFPTWFLVLSGAIACFMRPFLAFRLLVVALIFTIAAAFGGLTINGDIVFLKMFAVQGTVLAVAIIFLQLFQRKSVLGAT